MWALGSPSEVATDMPVTARPLDVVSLLGASSQFFHPLPKSWVTTHVHPVGLSSEGVTQCYPSRRDARYLNSLLGVVRWLLRQAWMVTESIFGLR